MREGKKKRATLDALISVNDPTPDLHSLDSMEKQTQECLLLYLILVTVAVVQKTSKPEDLIQLLRVCQILPAPCSLTSHGSHRPMLQRLSLQASLGASSNTGSTSDPSATASLLLLLIRLEVDEALTITQGSVCTLHGTSIVSTSKRPHRTCVFRYGLDAAISSKYAL